MTPVLYSVSQVGAMSCWLCWLSKCWFTWLKESSGVISLSSGVWNLVIWLSAISSSLFTVLIDTSAGLVFTQKVSSISCAPNTSSTVCGVWDVAWFVSETWAPRLASLLGAVVSSFVALSSTCAPAVPVVALSLFKILDHPLFFVGYWTWCWGTVLLDIKLPFQYWLDTRYGFLRNMSVVRPSWRFHSLSPL